MENIQMLLKLKPLLQKHKFNILLVLITIILSSLITIPIPYLIGKITDDILLGNKSINLFCLYIGLVTIIYIFEYSISILSDYLSSKLNNNISLELRYILIDKILKLPMDYLGYVEKGYLQGRISESCAITTSIIMTIVGALLNIVEITLSTLTMFSINIHLSTVVLFWMLLFIILINTTKKKLTKNTEQMLEANANLSSECFQIINGIEDIKILNGKEYSLSNLKNKLYDTLKISLKQNKIMIFLTQSISGIDNIGTVLILFISGILIIKGNFSVGLYTTFSLYSNKIFQNAKFLANVGPSLKQSCLSIERIYEFIDMKDENNGKTLFLNHKIESVSLENLTFKYKNRNTNTLDSLNFEITKGEKVLIKGENGAGKTTLIKLLTGLYEPIEGRLLYNNLDSKNINKDSLRARIGIVSQNIYLFKGTVLDNILYGKSETTRSDVEKLISKLHLEDYINKLPNGLDSTIIENNNGISGGQAQVIAFIRAIISDKDIIILDEPISNVDAETRNIILDILNKSKFEGILIIVSHFTEGMDFINRIINIDNKQEK